MLAGAFWALLAARSLVVSAARRGLIVMVALVLVLAEVLTAGRSGYVAWIATGVVMSLVKWPRYLLLAPIIAIVLALFPGVTGRAFEGFGSSADTGSSDDVDVDALTAGRNNIWPVVLDKIAEAPIAGYGREAMQRTGATAIDGEETPVTHPHNAYLEMLLETGCIGWIVTLLLFGYI